MNFKAKMYCVAMLTVMCRTAFAVPHVISISTSYTTSCVSCYDLCNTKPIDNKIIQNCTCTTHIIPDLYNHMSLSGDCGDNNEQCLFTTKQATSPATLNTCTYTTSTSH